MQLNKEEYKNFKQIVNIFYNEKIEGINEDKEKIKKEDRDTMPLLADGNHIVWIPGYRISAYYKVTPETKNIIRINDKNKE